MYNIKPISTLKNYNAILSEVTPSSPVILTKNGYGEYALVDIKLLQKFQAFNVLSRELKDGEESGYISLEESKKRFGVK